MTKQCRKIFFCPQCNKQRMLRDSDHVVSKEKQNYTCANKNIVSLYVDICAFCKAKNIRKHFQSLEANMFKSLDDFNKDLNEDESLEDML